MHSSSYICLDLWIDSKMINQRSQYLCITSDCSMVDCLDTLLTQMMSINLKCVLYTWNIVLLYISWASWVHFVLDYQMLQIIKVAVYCSTVNRLYTILFLSPNGQFRYQKYTLDFVYLLIRVAMIFINQNVKYPWGLCKMNGSWAILLSTLNRITPSQTLFGYGNVWCIVCPCCGVQCTLYTSPSKGMYQVRMIPLINNIMENNVLKFTSKRAVGLAPKTSTSSLSTFSWPLKQAPWIGWKPS